MLGEHITDEFYLSRIVRVTQGVLEDLVAQEGPRDLIGHNLGPLASLALQGGLEGRGPTLLWVPEKRQDEVTYWLKPFDVSKMKRLCICGASTHHGSWSTRDTWSSR